MATTLQFIALCIIIASCNARSTTLLPGCQYRGKTYQVGSFQPSACEHCQCTSSGKTFCAIADCFITPCVDPVHDPKHCCPQCPNGRNCRAPDGTIIKEGDTYTPDAYTMCTCQHSFSFSHEAICAHRAIDPPIDVGTDIHIRN